MEKKNLQNSTTSRFHYLLTQNASPRKNIIYRVEFEKVNNYPKSVFNQLNHEVKLKHT